MVINDDPMPKTTRSYMCYPTRPNSHTHNLLSTNISSLESFSRCCYPWSHSWYNRFDFGFYYYLDFVLKLSLWERKNQEGIELKNKIDIKRRWKWQFLYPKKLLEKRPMPKVCVMRVIVFSPFCFFFFTLFKK